MTPKLQWIWRTILIQKKWFSLLLTHYKLARGGCKQVNTSVTHVILRAVTVGLSSMQWPSTEELSLLFSPQFCKCTSWSHRTQTVAETTDTASCVFYKREVLQSRIKVVGACAAPPPGDSLLKDLIYRQILRNAIKSFVKLMEVGSLIITHILKPVIFFFFLTDSLK